ncbi:MAG TPA: cyclic-phosphate processing receiver domain-containing protein [Parafilimonas sp.]|nr:cyclic-phosphate processing receiver domain-containing protein [Parafilimonas sp.]
MNEPKCLFLDDKRLPTDCINYMQSRGIDASIYLLPWEIVNSYNDFINWIEQNGLPSIISFDHDLAEAEKSGMDAAKWLVNYCLEKDLPLPRCIVHSMNPVGAENIKALLNSYIAFQKSEKG